MRLLDRNSHHSDMPPGISVTTGAWLSLVAPQGQLPTLAGTKSLLVTTGHSGAAREANAPLSLGVFDVWPGATA